MKKSFNRRGPFFVLAALAFVVTGVCFAFQSKQRIVITAGVMTGGFKFNNVKIRHDPLVKASPVTHQVIIIGEAGEEVPVTPPPYSARLTPFSNPTPNPQIRVRVLYRYVPSLAPQDTTSPLTQLPIIDGPDYTAFAFEVTPSSVTTGFLQYRIVAERLQIIEGQLGVVAQVTSPPTTPQDPQPLWTVGVTANASLVFDANGGTFVLKDGNPVVGNTTLAIPAGILSGPTTITVDEVPLNSPSIPGGLSPINRSATPGGLSQPFAVYRLDADQPIHGIMQVALLYPDFEFPQGQDGIIDGTTVRAQDIAVVWWDGFKWRQLGGKPNLKDNTISVRISNLNYMAIVAAAPLSPEDRRPLEKIITPNGDGKNDVANFLFGDLIDNIKVEIFDIGGHRIKTIMSLTNMQWDGRDDDGRIVESGVYIYQYEVDGKRISGLIAVAK